MNAENEENPIRNKKCVGAIFHEKWKNLKIPKRVNFERSPSSMAKFQAEYQKSV
jgi:hypothetical protein